MNKKNTIIGASFIVLVVIGFFGFSQYNNKTEQVKLDDVFASKYTQDESSLKKFTVSDIANYSTESECYTIIRGYVYDLTSWVSLHPGGKNRILSICGKDGTDKFTQKHGGQIKFETILSHFKIGKIG